MCKVIEEKREEGIKEGMRTAVLRMLALLVYLNNIHLINFKSILK